MVKVLGNVRGRLGIGNWREGVSIGPTANSDYTTATAGGSDFSIDPRINDDDPAGDGLTIVEVSVDSASAADGGAATTNGQTITVTVPASERTMTISYTIRDANNLESSSTIEVDVQAVPEPGDGTVLISANRTSGTAPAGIMFEAAASGFSTSDPKRELRYKWNFGDTLAESFTALDDRADATVNGRSLDFRNSNIAYTYRAAHTFAPHRAEFSGAASKSYSVTCTVQDRDGNVATSAPFNVTIANPDHMGTVVVVDKTGAFDNVPAELSGALQRTSIPAAYSALGSAGGYISVRKGQDHSDAVLSLTGKTKVIIGTYGTGAKSKLNFGSMGIEQDLSEFAIRDFDFYGDWDVTTESSPTNQGQYNCFSWANFPNNSGFDTIHNCWGYDVNKIYGLVSPGGEKPAGWDRQITFNNVRVSGFREYGFLIGTSTGLAMTGIAIVDDPLKMQGTDTTKGGLTHNHGPIRVTVPREGHWNIFDAFQAQSWAGWSGSSGIEYDSTPAPQMSFRFNPGDSTNTSSGNRWNVDINFSRFIIEGGNTVGGFPVKRESNPFYVTHNIHSIIDKGIIICAATSISALTSKDSGCIVTNVLCIAPPMKMTRNADYGGLVNLTGSDAQGSRVRGLTLVNWIDPAVHNYGGGTREFEDFSAGSYGKYANIWHYPNGLTPVDLSSQLDLSHRLFAPRYPGLRFHDHDGDNGPAGAEVIDTSYAAPDTFTQDGSSQASVVLPVPIAGQLTTTKADAPVDDIFGEIRPATPHRGCVEPSSVPE